MPTRLFARATRQSLVARRLLINPCHVGRSPPSSRLRHWPARQSGLDCGSANGPGCSASGLKFHGRFKSCWALPPGLCSPSPGSGWKFVSAVEMPRHLVKIRTGFLIGKHPVTRRQLDSGLTSYSDLPATSVTWREAKAHCRQHTCLTGIMHRLPSEAEWEYVCRAGSTTVFPHGNVLTPADANYLYDRLGRRIGAGRPTPVGSHGANAFGVSDLLGNVCEWTEDTWHPGFAGAPDDGSAWTDGGFRGRRVIRGGAWDHLPRVLRASWRDWAPEEARWDNLGFRIVREGPVS